MKRATFAIPVAGLALVGCGDPIVGTWNVTALGGEAFPYTYDYTNANGAACTGTVSFQMIVNDDLTMTLSTSYVYVCDDGVQNPPSTESYAGTITVVDKKAKYDITVDGDTINCDMANNNALNCADDTGATITFALEE